MQLIRPILEQKLSVIDVTVTATDAYNTKLQYRLSRSVFVHCTSWYRVGSTGKVNSIFPGTDAHTCRRVRSMIPRSCRSPLVVAAETRVESL